jgi:hypothetical protein
VLQIPWFRDCISLLARKLSLDLCRRAAHLCGRCPTSAAGALLVLCVACGTPTGSNVGQPQTTAPPSPAHRVVLSWNASPSIDVVGYNVYRGLNSGGPYSRINSSIANGTTYTDSAVASGTTYYYVVTSVNGNGEESIYSNEASATVPSP